MLVGAAVVGACRELPVPLPLALLIAGQLVANSYSKNKHVSHNFSVEDQIRYMHVQQCSVNIDTLSHKASNCTVGLLLMAFKMILTSTASAATLNYTP